MNKPRTIILGLDGVPYELLLDLSRRGIMPNARMLIQKGVCRRMSSSIPEVSNVAWSSLITGANPGAHGIFGFTDMQQGALRLRFPSFNDLKIDPFWSNGGLTSVIINVPGTYPAKPMNGVHISGFVSIDLERSVYPVSLVPELQKLDYRLDVESERAHESMQLFLNDLDKTLKARIEAYRLLWSRIDWNVFMLVFTGTDRLMHFLWQAYEEPAHQYHAQFLNHFKEIDRALGEIIERLREDDTLIMVSDHGFERIDHDIYINHLLASEGLLKFKNDTAQLTTIDAVTTAFALDPARIYLNMKGKYPGGSVEEPDKETILRELTDLFQSLEYEGKNVIRRVFRKEELYCGEFFDMGPDLVLIGEKGFNLRGSMKTTSFAGRSIFTGKHTQDNALFLMYGNGVDGKDLPPDLSICDIRTVAEKVFTCSV